MWYVTLLLIHFCMLSSGCNAYQAWVDDSPPCQGQLCLDVSWWQPVWLLLLVHWDEAVTSPPPLTLPHPPSTSQQTPGYQVLHLVFLTVGCCRKRTHLQVSLRTVWWMSKKLHLFSTRLVDFLCLIRLPMSVYYSIMSSYLQARWCWSIKGILDKVNMPIGYLKLVCKSIHFH